MSHLLAASPSPHLLPWLAACSLSGEALATMLSATVPPLEPPGQQLPLCCRRSLLTLMLNIGFVCPLKHHCTCLTFTCQRCKMGVQEKPEEQRVKCSSLHGALMLRKGLADGRGVTPAQHRGDCRHGVVCPRNIPGSPSPLAQEQTYKDSCTFWETADSTNWMFVCKSVHYWTRLTGFEKQSQTYLDVSWLWYQCRMMLDMSRYTLIYIAGGRNENEIPCK